MALIFNISFLNGAGVEIAPYHAEQIAPAAVWLDAPEFPELAGSGGPSGGLAYDPSFHEITYIWTVRGQPLTAFTAPDNIPTEWNNPNVAYGKKVAFCFPDPGDYLVDLIAVDRTGQIASGYTTTISVADPDVVFSGANTVAFAADSNFTGKPIGAQEATTVSQIESILGAASTPIRLCMKAGETTDIGEIQLGAARRLSYLSSWGVGANPIIAGGFRMFPNYPENSMVMTAVDFQGNWDILTGTGYVSTAILTRASATNNDFTMTYYDVTVRGQDLSFNQTAGGGLSNDKMMVCNCTATDNRSLAIYTQNLTNGGRTAVIGTKVAQNPLARSMDGGGILTNGGGSLRFSDTQFAYIAMSDFFSHTGSFGLSPDIADAACLRLNTKGYAGVEYVVERNVCEGGYIPIEATSSNPADLDNGGNYLLEKNLIIHTAGSVGISIQTGRGMTIRNVMAYFPDTFYRYFAGQGTQRSFVSIKPTGAVAGNADEPLTIHNCTVLSDQSQGNEHPTDSSILDYFIMQKMDNPALTNFTNITEENNVIQNADSAKPSTEFAPVDVSQNFSGITPRYLGKRWDYKHHDDLRASETTLIGESLTLPYSDIGSETVGDVDVAGATDQNYWQSLPAGNDSHQLSIDGNFYSSEGGDFTVSYSDPLNLTITNTSVRDWTGYAGFVLKLDRNTEVPAMDTSQANPANVPIPRILSGSLTAAQTASSGLVAYDDLLGAVRSGTKVKGAVALV